MKLFYPYCDVLHSNAAVYDLFVIWLLCSILSIWVICIIWSAIFSNFGETLAESNTPIFVSK